MISLKPVFDKPASQYKRDLNVVGTYMEDAATYIGRLTGDDHNDIKEWVKEKVRPGGKMGMVDPPVRYLEREREGERHLKYGTMLGYLKKVEDNRYTLSPTMTAYTNPEDSESVLAQYVTIGLEKRSGNKEKMLMYKDQGDTLLSSIYNNRQQRNKIKNNSLSGAHGTTSSVLFNKSSHSTLTSTCRSASSNTNANVERLLGGNRHYWSAEITINNICSIVSLTDREKMESVIGEYNLHIPTVDEIMTAIERSTSLYWNSSKWMGKIRKLVEGLDAIERVSYLYTGDLYHLAKYNDAVVRDLFFHISESAEVGTDNPEQWIKALGEDEIALLGITTNHLMPEKCKLFDNKTKECDNYPIIGATARMMVDGINKYANLLDAVLVNPSVCPSMALYPSAVRSIVVASDTDSSIFTTQDWVHWYTGRVTGEQICFNVAAATTYLCSQYVMHVLAIMSGSMGVADKHLRMLSMKNEYAFKFFALTTMAKHYFASMDAQEGNVYGESKWEIKGVTLKNSTAPDELRKKSDDMIVKIGNAINNDEDMYLMDYVQEIADQEHMIIDSIRSGDPHFFRSCSIHAKEAYKNPDSNPYQHYTLWQAVFAPRYGSAPEPTYSAIAVKTKINSKGKWLNFIANIAQEDPTMAERLDQWCIENNKEKVGSFNLPLEVVEKSGIPKAIFDVMDIRDMVKVLMKSFYLILETLGYYTLNKKVTRLISDDVAPSEECRSKLKWYDKYNKESD